MPRDKREPPEILAHITSSRVALTSAMYGLSEADLTTQHPVGKWSVKDVMAHIGRWEEKTLEVLQAHLLGKQTPLDNNDYSDFLAYNDKWEAELQAYSLQEAIAYFETAHYQLFGFLSTLASEQWSGFVRAWVQGSAWHHFEEHAEQIRSWRANRG